MKQTSEDFDQANLRAVVSLLSIVAMLTGLFFSRALLSSGLIVFIILNIFHRNISTQIRAFFSSPLLWSMTLLFVLPLVSGLWSHDVHRWSQIMRIKLPLLLLPFCFAANDRFTFRDGQRIAFVFLLLTFAGVLQSLWYYLQHRNFVTVAYLQAHIIPTPMGDDHVRFSLTVAIASLTCFFLLFNKRKDYPNWTVAFLTIGLGIFVIYLHILGARTGLISFYLIAIVVLALHLVIRRSVKFILLFAAILLLPVVAFISLPTFKNRLLYLRYDLSLVQRDTYAKGSNDGNRIASIKAGWQIVRRHPLFGVGFGDVEGKSKDYYHTNYAAMTEADQILPSSEWMMYGAGNGWPGLICFSIVMLIPFILKDLRRNASWLALNLTVALSYLFDIGLEVQYGVFIHAFILLWWYKWLKSFKY